MDGRNEQRGTAVQFSPGDRTLVRRVFESCLDDVIADIQGYKAGLVGQQDLICNMGRVLANLRVMSDEGAIQKALEHVELTMLRSLERDLAEESD
jgi:hypothetical protein